MKIMTAAPNMVRRGDAYVFTWPGIHVQVELDYFYETRGDLYAELLIGDTLVDPPALIHSSRLNLNASNTRASLVKELKLSDPSLPWGTMLEEVCFLAKRAYRRGEPSILLRDFEVVDTERWLLEPYIEAETGSMSVIYADGGTGKSLFAMAMALTVAGDDQVIGKRKCGPMPVMYLDWEAGPVIQHKRLRAIAAGAGFGEMPDIHYRRMTVPLTYAAPAIRRELDDKGIGMVVVDSLGAAADGPIEESATALATCRAMMSFKRPLLGVHHMPKNTEGKRGAGAMFGSVYYANSIRLAWEMTGKKDEGAQTIAVQFVNTKNNNGVLEKRHAYQIAFRNDSRGDPVIITFDRAEVRDIAEFAEQMPLKDRILDQLRGGAQTYREIAEELNANEGTIKKTLSTLKSQGKVINLPDSRWGLAQ